MQTVAVELQERTGYNPPGEGAIIWYGPTEPGETVEIPALMAEGLHRLGVIELPAKQVKSFAGLRAQMEAAAKTKDPEEEDQPAQAPAADSQAEK